MLLITEVTGSDPKDGRQITDLMITHDVRAVAQGSRGARHEHTVRFFRPKPAAGPLGGEQVMMFVLTDEQAAELKAHL
jgi:hypothetical protein